MHQDSRKCLGYKLAHSRLKTCEACAAGKENHKNVTKSSDHLPAKENWDGIFLDIFTIKIIKYIRMSVTKNYWRIMADERTGLKFSYFSRQIMALLIQPVCCSANGGRGSRIVAYHRPSYLDPLPPFADSYSRG